MVISVSEKLASVMFCNVTYSLQTKHTDTAIIDEDDQNYLLPNQKFYAAGVLSALPISLKRISGSPRSFLHRFAMFSVGVSIKNLVTKRG